MKHSIQKTIGDSYQVNLTKLERFSGLLTQYLDGNVEREMISLHMIMQLMNNLQHPSGVLPNILSCLYDNFALSRAGLYKWRDDDTPQEGKGNLF